MKPLQNINDINLDLPTLIEASAGTGKTYTLAELFIRALRELKDATVESILVVTFTNAAAAELRGRLHARLLQEREKSKKAGGSDFEKWNTALLTFDKAGITTIHGFCERMLAEFAFEGALPFNSELDDSSGKVVDELVFDYWRKRMYSGEIDADVIRQCGMFTPGEIGALTQCSIGKPLARVEPEKVGIDRRCLDAVESLRKMFPVDSAALGIKPNAKKQIADFDALRALFDNPAWNQMPEELKISRVLESSRAIAGAASKGLATVVELLGVINDGYVSLKIRLMVEACNELAKPDEEGLTKVGREIRRHGVRTFDDILNDLRIMLERNPSAVEAMRQKFKIVMIDEFQDTDPVQWKIFHTVFMEGPEPHRMIVVGDPKQAIYSFRGGDIDTYCAVRDEISNVSGSVWTLTTNYRSEPSAVEAVNRVFLSKDEAKPTATFEKRDGGTGIGYSSIKAKTAHADTKSISLLQRADSAPLVDPSAGESSGLIIKKLGTGTDRDVAEDVIAEIRALLNSSEWKIFDYRKEASSDSPLPQDPIIPLFQEGIWLRDEGRAVRPGDICILSNSNHTARFYHDKLCLNSIPCTIRSEKSVFAEDEAQWIRSLLTVATSSARKGFGSLLATPMFGLDPEEIVRLTSDSRANSTELNRTLGRVDYASILRAERGKLDDHGIQSYFASVAEQCGIKQRLLRGPLGERHWTNLSQIIEILGSAAKTNHLTPEALQDWLEETIRGSDEKKAEYEFRLDSDAEAVTSMTIHKSKGLEFPIVFIPEFDKGDHQIHELETFHRKGDTIISCLLDAEAKESKKAEDLEESIRKLYVGLTRAVHRTYWYIADVDYTQGKNANGVIGHLQSNGQVFQIPEAELQEGTVVVLKAEGARITPGNTQKPVEPAAAKILESPPVVNPVAKPWVVTSFSGIKEGFKDADGVMETDVGEDVAGDVEEFSVANDPDDPSEKVLPARYTMEGGTVFGNAIHSVFEACPFDAEIDEIRELLEKELQSWHLSHLATDEELKHELSVMIHDTFHAEIPDAAGHAFKLADIPPEKRLSELAFFFPLSDGKRTEDLLEIFRSWGGIYEKSLVGIGKADRILRGMLKGYIDLIFEHNGQYYIADWKTNKMDAEPGAFEIDPANPLESRMAQEIAHSQYSIQWAIYAVALHRHLSNTLLGYDYATHFGGVRYCFVRGMSPERPSAGVWVQTPPPSEDMAALDGFFGAPRERAASAT